MDRLKTFLIYALCVIGFFIFSEVIINVGLNSSYKDMQAKGNIEQVQITQAQSTLINGRIKGIIRNTNNEDLYGKYIKIDIYSERDVLLGSKYYEIKNFGEDGIQNFELYYEAQYSKYYDVSISNEKKDEGLEIKFLQNDLTKSEILLGTFLILIFV